MILKVIFLLLISSAMIASESSCDKTRSVTVQDSQYLKFNKGFFYIHGLTNGESVVMYKTPDDTKIHVQYTIVNSECIYETLSYNIIHNRTFVDHVKVLNTRKKFLIRNALCFIHDGKAVEVKFQINKKGFVLNKVTNGPAIEAFELKPPANTPGNKATNVVSNDITAFEFVNKDSIELNDMNNGRFFYQNCSDFNYIKGSYVYKTSSGDYYTFDYSIENPFQDNSSLNLERYEIKDPISYYEKLGVEVIYKINKFK